MRVALVGGSVTFVELVSLELAEADFEVLRVSERRVSAFPIEEMDLALVAGRTTHADGPHLTAALHRLRADLPVVMLTGSHNAERKGYQAGAAMVMVKPFELSELVAVLQRLGRRPARRPHHLFTSPARSPARIRST